MKKDLVSIDDLSLEQLERYLLLAATVENTPERDKARSCPAAATSLSR